jgi:hypothetical protein
VDSGATRFAAQQTQILLLAGQHARERDPGAQRFAGRHRIGVDDQRLGDAHAARRDAAPARRTRFPYRVEVVAIRALHRPRRRRFQRRCPARGGLRIEQEQVGNGAREVERLAVDDEVFELVARLPRLELPFTEVGDVPSQSLFHLRLGHREVEADAAHALALEFEIATDALACPGSPQQFVDACLRHPEPACVDSGGHLLHRSGCLRAGRRRQQRKHQRRHRGTPPPRRTGRARAGCRRCQGKRETIHVGADPMEQVPGV